MRPKKIELADLLKQLEVATVLFYERGKRVPLVRPPPVAAPVRRHRREQKKWLRLIHRQLRISVALLRIRAAQEEQWKHLAQYVRVMVILKIQEIHGSRERRKSPEREEQK